MLDAPTTKPSHWTAELRASLIFAGLMLAIPLGAKLAARYGWMDTANFTQRSLMAILAAYIVFTGNTIPKRITSLTCQNADPARVQAFHRLAGWVWVLTGLAFGFAWILLPRETAGTATLVIVPLGIALIAYRWFGLYAARRPAA
jgi:hypothetical protein